MLVVDDVLLLHVLGGVADRSVTDHLERGELYTTGAWYLRLSRAVHDARSIGALTRELAALERLQLHRAPRRTAAPHQLLQAVLPARRDASGSLVADSVSRPSPQAAAIMIGEGAHLLVVKERLGHSTIAVTADRYGHLYPSLSAALTSQLDVLYRDAQMLRPRLVEPD